MNGKYEIKIEVNGAPSGSEKQANIKFKDPLAGEREKRQKQQIADDKLKQEADDKRTLLFNNVKAGAAGVVAVGTLGLDIYEQNAKFQGDSGTVNRINETKSAASKVVIAGGLIASGNVLAGAIYLGYTAYAYAKENRELIFAQTIDSYQASYYQTRLINDVSKRSR